jgi:dolichol kinase
MGSILWEEITRQSIHFLLGIFYLILLFTLPLEICSSLIGGIALLGLSFSLMLSKQLIKFKPLLWVIKKLSRAGELAKAGEPALWFTLGTALVILLFPSREIAIGALIVLTFGDSISTIVGRIWGRTIIRGWRTLEGSAAGVIFAAIALSFIFPIHIALIASAVGMMGEFLPFEDNVTIPLLAALALSAATFLSF